MTRITCRTIRPLVRWTALEGAAPNSRVSRHLESCLNCQAEAARARLQARRLRSVFESVEVPPAALLGGVMAATLDQGAPGHRATAAIAATVTAAAGAVFLIRRHQLSSR